MSRLRSLVVAGAIGATGCTLLIDFDEVPALPADAETPDATPASAPRDAATDTNESLIDGPIEAGPTDARPPEDGGTNPDACRSIVDGKHCGSAVKWPRKDDLVTCQTSKVAVVTSCATGQGCLGMLDGYPDECDACAAMTDGTYCGRDFTGWDAKNAQQRIRCQGGRVVGSLLCTICKSNGVNAVCQ